MRGVVGSDRRIQLLKSSRQAANQTAQAPGGRTALPGPTADRSTPPEHLASHRGGLTLVWIETKWPSCNRRRAASPLPAGAPRRREAPAPPSAPLTCLPAGPLSAGRSSAPTPQSAPSTVPQRKDRSGASRPAHLPPPWPPPPRQRRCPASRRLQRLRRPPAAPPAPAAAPAAPPAAVRAAASHGTRVGAAPTPRGAATRGPMRPATTFFLLHEEIK